MAVTKSSPVRKPIAEVRKENEELHKKIEALENGGYCYMCGKHKAKTNFYQNTDPNVKSGITGICKDCAKNIACRYDEKTGEYLGCTKESVMEALTYIDKPFLVNLWDAAYYELQDETTPAQNKRKTIWGNYIKNVSIALYNGLRWKDSDIFTGNYYAGSLDKALSSEKEEEIQRDRKERQKELAIEYKKNREDVIKLYHYDPFEYEAEEDKPIMYAQVSNMCNTSDESEDDVIKLNSIISIVKLSVQVEKNNREISRLQNEALNDRNISAIKSLTSVNKDMNNSIINLAKESKLSKGSSGTSTKGTNTWTGKVKILKEMKLREEEVNAFEVETCKGMQQVAELSDAAIIKQIGLDENDYSDMLIEQRNLITKIRKDKNLAEERMRILYRENVDLKRLLEKNAIKIDKNLESNYLFAPEKSKEVEADESDS